MLPISLRTLGQCLYAVWGVGQYDDLEQYYCDTIHCLESSADSCIPSVKIGLQKHWWTPELDEMKMRCLEITNPSLWKYVGRICLAVVISILSALDVNISTNKRYEMLQLKMTNAGMIVFLIIFVKKRQ